LVKGEDKQGGKAPAESLLREKVCQRDRTEEKEGEQKEVLNEMDGRGPAMSQLEQ